MDQRKLIRLGNSSFAIALPKEWVDRAGLKKGDAIFITPNSNGELIIQPRYKGANGEKKVVLNLENKTDKEIEKEISSAYVKDYNLFELRGFGKERKNHIEHLLKSLISLEIIEKNKDLIVAKDFFDFNEINLENFLRRIDNSMRNMFEETEILIKKGLVSTKELKEIYEIDWDINRLYFLIYRVFIKGLNNPAFLSTIKIDCITLLKNWQIAVNIEEAGDELKRVCKLLNRGVELKEKEKIFGLFLEAKKAYVQALLGYYNKDSALSRKVSLCKNEQVKKCEELSRSKEVIVAQIAEKFKHIFSSIHDMSELILYTINENGRKE